jgi:hypothetical protein
MTGLRRWAEEQPLPARLYWTAEYFRWCGMSSAVFIGVAVVSLPVVPGMRAAIVAHPFKFGLGLASITLTAAAWWWTGERLLARRRDGAWWAIVALALPVLELVRGGASPSGLTLLISVFGLVAILTSWRELE